MFLSLCTKQLQLWSSFFFSISCGLVQRGAKQSFEQKLMWRCIKIKSSFRVWECRRESHKFQFHLLKGSTDFMFKVPKVFTYVILKRTEVFQVCYHWMPFSWGCQFCKHLYLPLRSAGFKHILRPSRHLLWALTTWNCLSISNMVIILPIPKFPLDHILTDKCVFCANWVW